MRTTALATQMRQLERQLAKVEGRRLPIAFETPIWALTSDDPGKLAQLCQELSAKPRQPAALTYRISRGADDIDVCFAEDSVSRGGVVLGNIDWLRAAWPRV